MYINLTISGKETQHQPFHKKKIKKEKEKRKKKKEKKAKTRRMSNLARVGEYVSDRNRRRT